MEGENAEIDLIEFSQSEEQPDQTEQLCIPSNENCGKCAKRIEANNRRIQCAVCLLWHHLGCTQVSVKLYNCLKESSDVHFYCEECSKGAKSLHHKVTGIWREHEIMKREINELKMTNEGIDLFDTG